MEITSNTTCMTNGLKLVTFVQMIQTIRESSVNNLALKMCIHLLLSVIFFFFNRCVNLKFQTSLSDIHFLSTLFFYHYSFMCIDISIHDI